MGYVAPLRPRAHDQREGAMDVHMIFTTLGVVLDDEDHALFPEFGARKCMHKSPHGVIVVGDHGFGSRVGSGCAHGVVVGEQQVGEIRELTGVDLFENMLYFFLVSDAVVDEGATWELGVGIVDGGAFPRLAFYKHAHNFTENTNSPVMVEEVGKEITF